VFMIEGEGGEKQLRFSIIDYRSREDFLLERSKAAERNNAGA